MDEMHVVVIMRGGCVEKILIPQPEIKVTLVDWDNIFEDIEKKQETSIVPGNYSATVEPNIDKNIKITNQVIQCMIHPGSNRTDGGIKE